MSDKLQFVETLETVATLETFEKVPVQRPPTNWSLSDKATPEN